MLQTSILLKDNIILLAYIIHTQSILRDKTFVNRLFSSSIKIQKSNEWSKINNERHRYTINKAISITENQEQARPEIGKKTILLGRGWIVLRVVVSFRENNLTVPGKARILETFSGSNQCNDYLSNPETSHFELT